jgi:hypothetical protein
MQAIKSYFSQFDLVLFYAYIWQIPFAWRYIFSPNRGDQTAGFNEYMDISLYAGEILLIFALLLHIINNITYKKSIVKSIDVKNRQAEVFHMEHAIVVCLMMFIVLNIAISIDPLLSIATIVHLSSLVIFCYLFREFIVSRGTSVFREILIVLFFSLLIQFGISFLQVMNNESAGAYFLNESFIKTDMLNVAKSNIHDHIFLRGYGTFPHPNVLGAFALLIMAFIYECRTVFHVKQSTLIIILISSFSVILLSQSKLALIACIGISFFYLIQSIKKHERFHVKHFLYFVFAVLLVLVVSLYFKHDIVQSYLTRIDQVAKQLNVTEITALGSGIGTYRLSYDSHLDGVEWWLYEPIHFVPYIIIEEIGILGTLLALVIVFIFIKNVSRGTLKNHYLILVYLAFVLGSDHYAWDIYQGQFMLAFGLALATLNIDKIYRECHNIV